MTTDVAAALTEEHRHIDAGLEAFLAALDNGTVDSAPVLDAFSALQRHIYLEEELLFPPIRAAGLMMPVMVMEREHGELWQLMEEVSALVGESAPSTDDVAAKCRELLALLDNHNGKEEPIIYPQASTDLDEAATGTLADLIASGSMPDGWVPVTRR